MFRRIVPALLVAGVAYAAWRAYRSTRRPPAGADARPPHGDVDPASGDSLPASDLPSFNPATGTGSHR